jgi:hypothetical protein
LLPFPPDVDDRAAIGGADVTDIGSAQLVGAQPGKQAGQHQRQVPFGPVGAARGLVVAVHRLEQRGDRGLGEGAGQRVGRLGAPDERHEVGRDQFGGVEEVAQHIPRRPAPADRGRFVRGRVGGEGRPQGVFRYVN